MTKRYQVMIVFNGMELCVNSADSFKKAVKKAEFLLNQGDNLFKYCVCVSIVDSFNDDIIWINKRK